MNGQKPSGKTLTVRVLWLVGRRRHLTACEGDRSRERAATLGLDGLLPSVRRNTVPPSEAAAATQGSSTLQQCSPSNSAGDLPACDKKEGMFLHFLLPHQRAISQEAPTETRGVEKPIFLFSPRFKESAWKLFWRTCSLYLI